MHGYAYANNSPVTYTDPDGLAFHECGGGSICEGNGGLGDTVSKGNKQRGSKDTYRSAPGRDRERSAMRVGLTRPGGRNDNVSVAEYAYATTDRHFHNMSPSQQRDMLVETICHNHRSDSAACQRATAARDVKLKGVSPLEAAYNIYMGFLGEDINACAGGDALSCVVILPWFKWLKMFKAARHVNDAYEHGYKYHLRIRKRGVEGPRAHNFPYSFDDEVLKVKPETQNDGSLLYRKEGYMNGKRGFFEIAVNPDTGVIFHRMFRPQR